MIRKTIACLLIFIFALLAIPTLALRSISTTYLNPNFYEGKIIDETYTFAVDYISNEIVKDPNVSKYFNFDEIKTLLTENFTKENITEVTKDFISQLKAISEKRKSDAIKISLAPIKENIGKISEQITEKILSKVPDCTEGIQFNPAASDQIPACFPLELDKNAIKSEITNEIKNELMNVVPGEFILDLSKEGQSTATNFTDILNIMKYLEMILPLFMLIILLLIMLIIYKPYTTVMGFSGAALILGGIFSLIAGQIVKYLPNYLSATEPVNEIINLIISVFTQKIIVYSLYLFGIGSIIVLLAVYLRKRQHNPQMNDA